MLITTMAALALFAPPATQAAHAAPKPALSVNAVQFDHGKLPWHKGTFEELLAQAKKENKPVFIDFWAEW